MLPQVQWKSSPMTNTHNFIDRWMTILSTKRKIIKYRINIYFSSGWGEPQIKGKKISFIIWIWEQKIRRLKLIILRVPPFNIEKTVTLIGDIPKGIVDEIIEQVTPSVRFILGMLQESNCLAGPARRVIIKIRISWVTAFQATIISKARANHHSGRGRNSWKKKIAKARTPPAETITIK